MTEQLSRAEDDLVATMMATFGPDVLNRMNVDFEDSVLFVGRILGGRPKATGTQITAIDRLGVDIVVTDPDGEHRGRVDFAHEITEIGQLTEELLGLVVHARKVSGEPGTTSGEREFAKLTAIRTFITEVVAVADINPHCRQVTFGGEDLKTFRPAGPDSFLYLLVPPPGSNELAIDQSFTWDAYWQMPDELRPVGAYYTVRHWRPESAEIDVLFVLHDEPGNASGWALRARPGDPAALWGPRTAFEPPDTTDWYLLVADDTGLPAVASILEHLPDGTRARVFVEVDGPAEHLGLPVSPTIDVTWLHRDGAAPGTTTGLPDAVRALTWPGGTPYVWGGGESRTMTQVRRYVRHEIGLPRDAVTLQAYWRHPNHSDDDTDDDA
jgi:NADPH-dependent ferric siderophore reductase